MKKTKDPFEGLSKSEIRDKEEAFSNMEITKEEERQLILAALKTFLPPALLIVVLFGLVIFLVF